jgi:thiamine-monophosphate kinase
MHYDENTFVEWLRLNIKTSPCASISIGDDAALLHCQRLESLVATDMLLENIHFKIYDTPPQLIGRKAIAVNFSDIAAMGGTPTSVFISLAVPKHLDSSWIESLMLGAQELCTEFNCGIDGGDTNSWDGPLVINVTVTGTPHYSGIVRRLGAKPGDVVMVSGNCLGGSYASGRHLTFTPRIREAQWLLDHFTIHSMMDLSDGLATDARRLAKASNKKLIFEASQIADDGLGLRHAFCDGEDFELLFTCDEATATMIEANASWPCGFRRIGSVSDGSGVFIAQSGHIEQIPAEWTGWVHPMSTNS